MSTRSRSSTSVNVNKNSNGHNMKEASVRRRILKACNYCRQRKIKCNGNAPCLNCKNHDIQCEYSKTIRKRARQPVKKVTLQDLEKRMNQMDDKYSLVIDQLHQITKLLKEKNISNDIKPVVGKKRGRKPKNLSLSSNEAPPKEGSSQFVSETTFTNDDYDNKFKRIEFSEEYDNDNKKDQVNDDFNDSDEYDYSDEIEDEEVFDGEEYEYSEDLETESLEDEQYPLIEVPYGTEISQRNLSNSESLPISPVASYGSSTDQNSDTWRSALTPNDNFSFNSLLENNSNSVKYPTQPQLGFNDMSNDLTNMENKLDLLYGEIIPPVRSQIVYDF